MGSIVMTTARVDKAKFDGQKAEIVANHRARFYKIKLLTGPGAGTEKDVVKTTVTLQAPLRGDDRIAAALGAKAAAGDARSSEGAGAAAGDAAVADPSATDLSDVFA